MKSVRCMMAFVVSMAAAEALAFANLGEALDAGGKILAEDEFRKTVLGATLTGPTRSGGEIDAVYRASGSFNGTISVRERSFGIHGPWTLDASGKVCVETTNASTNNRETNCGYILRVGERYFFTPSSTDRETWIVPRTFKK